MAGGKLVVTGHIDQRLPLQSLRNGDGLEIGCDKRRLKACHLLSLDRSAGSELALADGGKSCPCRAAWRAAAFDHENVTIGKQCRANRLVGRKQRIAHGRPSRAIPQPGKGEAAGGGHVLGNEQDLAVRGVVFENDFGQFTPVGDHLGRAAAGFDMHGRYAAEIRIAEVHLDLTAPEQASGPVLFAQPIVKVYGTELGGCWGAEKGTGQGEGNKQDQKANEAL